MARRGTSRRSPPRSRDASATSLPGYPVSIARPSPWSSFLSSIEDNRLFNFDMDDRALTIGNRLAKVVVHKRPIIARRNTLWSARGFPVGVQVPVGIRFESPFRVITCIRRRVRRAVILATGRGGKGVRRRKPRRNTWSGVSC